MQGYTQRCETKFLVQTKLLEAEEIFVEVFSKIAAYELFTAVVESVHSVRACVGEGGSEQIGKMRLHPVVHDSKLPTKALNVVFDVTLQGLDVNAVFM